MRIERLDERAVLATWTGAGDGTNWETAGNWNTGLRPGMDAGETVADFTGLDIGVVQLSSFLNPLTSVSFISSGYTIQGGGTLNFAAAGNLTQGAFGTNTISTNITSVGAMNVTLNNGNLTLGGGSSYGYSGTTNINGGTMLTVNATTTTNPLGSTQVNLNGGTLDLNTAAPTLANTLGHSGFMINNDALAFNLHQNGGMLGYGDPTQFNNFEGLGTLTVGPASRGLDFDNDGDWQGVPASLRDDSSGDGFVINGSNDNYSNLIYGTFTPNVTGNWTFRNAGDDDVGAFWLDTNQNGVFESSTPGNGDDRGEQMSFENGTGRTRALNAGQSYLVAFLHNEDGGGSALDIRVTSPSFTERVIRPQGEALQTGLWNFTNQMSLNLNNNVVVSSNSQINVNGGANLGALTMAAGAGQLTVHSDHAVGTMAGKLTFTGTTNLDGTKTFHHTGNSTLNFQGVVQNGGAAGGITKSGNGVLYLGNNNTYTGDVTVGSGSLLVLGNNGALGNETTGKTTIQSGGTLDIRGNRAGSAGNELVEVSGDGVGGFGAIRNSGAQNTDAFRRITLLGNATFRTETRWDIRNTGGTATFTMNGFTLTKVGPGDLAMVNVTMASAGGVNVNEAVFRIEGSTDWDSAGTINVVNGATLDFWNNTNTISTNITLQGGANLTTNDGAGAGPTLANTVNLAGTANFNLEKDLQITGQVIGGGGITKVTGTGMLTLSNPSNNYTGLTTINAGSLRITNNTALGASGAGQGTVVNSGGTLDINGAFDLTTAEPITIIGGGAGGVGAINKTGGSGQILSPITLLGSTTFGSGTAGSKLTLPTGSFTLPVTATVTFTGVGDIDVGAFGNGALPTSFNALHMRGYLNAGIDDNDMNFDPSGSSGGGLFADVPVGETLFTGNLDINGDAAFQALIPGINRGDNYQTLFTGTFHALVAGNYTFQTLDKDDRTVIWLDRDQDGVFENAGFPGTLTNEQLVGLNNGTSAAISLAVGEYAIAFGHMENTGGSRIHARVQTPAGAGPTTLTDINLSNTTLPSAGGQLGLFTTLFTPTNHVIKNGTGTVTFLDDNTYNGTTTINQGTLVITQPGGLGDGPAGTVVRSGGTLGLSNVNISGEAITANGTGASGRPGAIANLSGVSSYTGVITAEVASSGTLGIGSSAGTLTLNGTINQQFSQVTFAGAGDVVVNSTIGGVGVTSQSPGIQETIYKSFSFPTANDDAQDNIQGIRDTALGSQDGKGILMGDINYTSNTIVANRALALGATSFATNTGWTMLWVTSFTPNESGQWGFRFTTVDDDASFWLDTTGTAGTFELTDRFYNRGCCGGSGDIFSPSLTAGTTYLLGIVARDFNGGNFTNMQFRSPTAAGITGGNWVTINATNYPTTFRTVTVANNALVKTGAGTVTLAGNNTYNGETTVTGGTLIAAHDSALGNGPAGTTVESGVTLSFSGGVTVPENVTVVAGGNLVNAAGDNTLSGSVDLVSLPPIQNYAQLDMGRGSGQVEPGFTAITLGTTADVNGTNFATTGFTSLTGDAYTVALSNVDQAGATVGGLDWRDRGDGPASVPLARLAEDQVKSNVGVIRVTLGSVPAGTYNVTAYHANSQGSNSNSQIINVHVNTGAGFTQVTPPGTVGTSNYTGNSAGLTTAAVELTKSTFTFTADGTNDVIIVFDGRPFASDPETDLNGMIIQRVNPPGGTATVNTAAGMLTLSGQVQDSGSALNLVKSGPGMLALSGNNIYDGTTTVSAGTLLANNATSSTGNAAVTVANNATLGGTGTIGGPVTLLSGAKVNPGPATAPGVGTLTVNNTVDFQGGSNLTIDMSGGLADLLTATGNVTVAATATLTLPAAINFAPSAGTPFTLLAAANAITPFAGQPAGQDNVLNVPGGNRLFDATYSLGTNDFGLVVVNRPPPVPLPGGPYTIAEGAALPIALLATASDPDNDPLTYAWDIDGDQDFADGIAATANPSLSWAQLVALGINDGTPTSTYQARVRVSDGIAPAVISAPVNLVVTNANPTINTSSIPSGGTEGTAVSLSAAATDPAGALDPLVYTWTITGPGIVGSLVLTGAGTSFVPPDNGVYSVGLLVTDDDGGSASTSGNVNVSNVNPIALINGAASGSQPTATSVPVPLTFSWTDAPGDPGTATYNIVNNATSAVVVPPTAVLNGAIVNQVFAGTGSFTVTLTVLDGDGGTGVATRVVTVQRFFEDASGNLIFGGDNGSDKITFSANTASGAVTATHTLNSVTTRYTLNPSSPSAKVIAYGQGQNDDIRVSGAFPYAVEFFGGSGNDYLAGGPLADLLEGGLGNDTLLGGAGDDTALGQDGADKLDGGSGHDWLDGGIGRDSLTGNTGNDTVFGGDGDDTVGGAAGDDYLDGGLGRDILTGNDGNDVLLGGGGDDNLNAGGGNDFLVGGFGLDILNAGAGDDILVSDEIAFADPVTEALAILDGWVSGPSDYDARVDTMLLGLLSTSMVLDDGVRDTMTGGVGSDWFLSPSLDRMTDYGFKAPEERING